MTEGEVCDKKFVPAHDETDISLIPISTGKVISFIPMPYDVDYEDEWRITIAGMFRGKERREAYTVSQEQFEKIQIGSHVNINEL
jgi:hypothetical protein